MSSETKNEIIELAKTSPWATIWTTISLVAVGIALLAALVLFYFSFFVEAKLDEPETTIVRLRLISYTLFIVLHITSLLAILCGVIGFIKGKKWAMVGIISGLIIQMILATLFALFMRSIPFS